ncbi:MAG: alpha/beta hydrolase [Sphingomonas sp.]
MIRSLLLAVALCFAGPASAQELWKTLPDVPAMPAPAGSGAVENSGAKIHYATYGEGPPVILLHGGLANGEYWANQVAPLAKTRRVIVIDSRGHGRSSRDDRPYTYELMASDVLAVMDALGVPKASIVGWSDGAIIGLVLAIHHPERLDRIFAFAANMDPSGVNLDAVNTPTFASFIVRAGADYKRLSPTPDGFDAFAAAIGKMWEVEPNYTAADLARIHVPVAIVDGDHDEAIRIAHTEYLAKNIPGARLIWLPGLSHFAMLQDPAAFDAALTSFLGAP